MMTRKWQQAGSKQAETQVGRLLPSSQSNWAVPEHLRTLLELINAEANLETLQENQHYDFTLMLCSRTCLFT